MSPERIARAYYAIVGIYTLSASLIWGINTLFLLRVGHLTLMEVFIANAVFTGSMALFEVPTGIVADTRGRRLSFLLSIVVLFIGTALYVAVPLFEGGLLAFSLASVVLGLGFTFYSGAVEAWVVDALNAAGDDRPIDRVLARGAFVSSAAMLVGTVSGGFLGGLHLSLPYVIRGALLLVAFGVALVAMHDYGFETRPLPLRNVTAEMLRVGREGIRFGWDVPRARYAIIAGAMPAIFLEWGYHAWQPYFLDLLGSDAVWILGVVAAAIAVATMAGNALVERLTRYCGKRSTLLLGASVVYSLSAIAVGLATSFGVAVAFYLVGMMSAGVFQPVRQAYLHLVVPREQRATVLSLASLVASGGSMAGQGGLGWLGARWSLGLGYVVGGALTALAIPAVLRMRRSGGVPDAIVAQAGVYQTCPSLALPEVVTSAGDRDLAAVVSDGSAPAARNSNSQTAQTHS